ncbi:MAG: tol-pal system protein YbgF [Alphaproteobacteria bacterium]|nr:tol-pal system protein YbgF [Alphaproteobacteria bacterium]
MNPHLKTVSTTALVLCTGLFLLPSLKAQNNGDLVVELIKRVGNVEEDNRQLRGQLEEAHHEISQLKQKMDTLSSDVDYRLSTPGGTSAVPPVPSPPHPLGSDFVSPSSSDASNSSDEYERARSLLEQGEYDAAERAFAAFVQAHPKDEQAGAAQYWLGVTFFVRGEHEKASSAFAKGYKNYPKSPKAADTLLKLSKSLAALDQKANACATLEQLTIKHPNAHTKEVANDQKKLNCKS